MSTLTATSSVKSGLGKALLKLQQCQEQQRVAQVESDQQFARWQSQWAGRTELISNRLQWIHAELERMTCSEPTRPQLLVVHGGESVVRGDAG